MRGLTIDDLERFKMIARPQLSPDAEKILYLVTVPDGDKYRTTLEVIKWRTGDKQMSLTDGDPTNPSWSPFGDKILYTSRKGMDEKEKGTGLWVTPLSGEPELLAKFSGGVSSPRWSSDGKSILFVSGVGEMDEDVRVVDKIPIWYNGEGWTYYKTKHLHRYVVSSGECSRLTEGDIDVQCYAESSDGEKIAYCQSANPLRPGESDLTIHDCASGVRDRILSGYMIQSLHWSPDGKQIAFMGHDGSRGYATHVGVHLMEADGGPVKNLTGKLDRGCSRRHYYDIRSMNAGDTTPLWEDEYIYFPVSNGDRHELHRLNTKSQSISPVLNGEYSLEEYSVKSGIVAYTRVNVDKPAELWVNTGVDALVTDLNKDVMAEVWLSPKERFSFTQKDGAVVEGWILKPNGWDKGERYPAIVDIHGGPKSKFGDSLMYEHQIYAANGYTVIYINIRGSGGYSQEFGDIRGDWGVWDYEDLMRGVKTALEVYPWIDKKRLGVTGLSYGGFMTNWVITHSDFFRTAISQNSISNWTAFFGTSDIGFHFTPEQIGGNPWSSLDIYIEKSPITYANQVDTPVLFIHSWNDYRCWIDQSIEFFTALKYLGKETQLAMFMEGPHTFRSVAKLSLRKRRYQIMLDWFNKYLKV
ncbi:MAG: S9 family peptidase [Candidatus Bathyarchaeota archaeon]